MAYPTKLLGEGEQIITETRLHWVALLKEILYTIGFLILIIVLLAATSFPGWVYLLLLLGWAAASIKGVSNWLSTDLVLTNRRLIFRQGFFSKKGYEIAVDRIQDIGFQQSGIQRMFGSGDLLVESGGTSGRTAMRNVPDPMGFKQSISETREARVDERFSQAGQRPESPPPPASSPSRAEQLEILARLHADGSLSDTEFEAEKSKLLGDQ
jgi:uncharacterized membrane protein YdbT with pleckstrin-like domain